MNKNKYLFRNSKFILLIITLIIFTVNEINAQSAEHIFLKSISLTDPENMEMISSLIIEDARGRQRKRKITSARKQFGTSKKMLMRFISPQEVAGTSMLIYDHLNDNDEMWIYLPALNKVRRIISTEKGGSFMGSEFTNADMSKPNPNNYTFQRLEDEPLEGIQHFVILLICKDSKTSKELGYQYKKIWINKETFLTRKIIFSDQLNKPFKIEQFSKYKEVDENHFIATLLEMENLKNNRKSYLNIEEYQPYCALSKYYFIPNKLINP